MGRRIELTGDALRIALYALQLTAVLLALLFVVPRFDRSAGVPFALLLASLVAATAVGLWRTRTDGDGPTPARSADDITYDPFADPGQAARDRWETAVRRLPGGDDEGD